jgi:hypothetical protein
VLIRIGYYSVVVASIDAVCSGVVAGDDDDFVHLAKKT